MAAPLVTIHHRDLRFDIDIANTNAIRPHEEALPSLVDKMMKRIHNDGYVKHPVIVDKKTLVILDGTHRFVALKRLGCKWVPVCLVNYKSPQIHLSSWYRTISDLKTENQLPKILKSLGVGITKTTQKAAESAVGSKLVPASILTSQSGFIVNSKPMDIRRQYDLVKRIEEATRKAGATIEYATPEDAKHALNNGTIDAVIVVPQIDKKSVITVASKKQFFARKATRHIIPARPLNLFIPLEILRNRNLTVIRAKLKELFRKKHLKHLPPGSTVGGRSYEEDVYVFGDMQS